MEKAFLAIIALAGLCVAGVELNNFAAQCWLNISGGCGFAYGMVRLGVIFKAEEMKS